MQKNCHLLHKKHWIICTCLTNHHYGIIYRKSYLKFSQGWGKSICNFWIFKIYVKFRWNRYDWAISLNNSFFHIPIPKKHSPNLLNNWRLPASIQSSSSRFISLRYPVKFPSISIGEWITKKFTRRKDGLRKNIPQFTVIVILISTIIPTNYHNLENYLASLSPNKTSTKN